MKVVAALLRTLQLVEPVHSEKDVVEDAVE
jgi:hypothetical protein